MQIFAVLFVQQISAPLPRKRWSAHHQLQRLLASCALL